MFALRPTVEEDIPAVLALWQGLPGIGPRDADGPEALARCLRRNLVRSFVALADTNELAGANAASR